MLPQLRSVRPNATPLVVREWGAPDDGPPLLFWHALGPTTSGAYLSEIAPVLAGEFGVRVLAVDAPGFGRSPAVPPQCYEVAWLARLALGALDELGIRRAVLAGHSWGGAVALYAAAAEPARAAALVLLDSGHADYADWPGAKPESTLAERVAEAASRTLAAPSWEAFLAEQRTEPGWREALAEVHRGGVVETAAGVASAAPAAVRGAALHGLARSRPSAAWPVLAAAGTPTLLLLATEPPGLAELNRGAAAEFGLAVPQAVVRECPGWRHDLIVDGGEELARLVGAFIDAARPPVQWVGDADDRRAP